MMRTLGFITGILAGTGLLIWVLLQQGILIPSGRLPGPASPAAEHTTGDRPDSPLPGKNEAPADPTAAAAPPGARPKPVPAPEPARNRQEAAELPPLPDLDSVLAGSGTAPLPDPPPLPEAVPEDHPPSAPAPGSAPPGAGTGATAHTGPGAGAGSTARPEAAGPMASAADFEAAPEPASEPPDWQPFWRPFNTRSSAAGFAAVVSRRTGLEIRVQQDQEGFRVAYPYHDDAEYEDHRRLIESGTGLAIELR